jgi:hypothetical protein
MPNAGQDAFLAAVEGALSVHRLRLGFRDPAGKDPRNVLVARHLRNMALSEALYPVLHTLELALRNSIDATFQAEFPDATLGHSWLSSESVILTRRDREEVALVESRLRADHKDVTRHRLVAGLNLGFWTNLLTRKYEISDSSSYEPKPGVQTALWPRHLRTVFPNLQKRFLTRDHVYTILSPIARLRNAVFHQRPIWNEKLNALHVTATEAIGWISPELKQVTVRLDRFPSVYSRKEESFRRVLKEIEEDF